VAGKQYDNPNQDVVRAADTAPATAPSGDEYDTMSKAQLLDLAQSRGLSPANAAMTKDELAAALRESD